MTSGPEDLFNEALDLPPAERADFLGRACGRDLELLGEVESLLKIADRRPDLLRVPEAPVSFVPEPDAPDPPTAIGPYKVEGLCGAGGSGIVYRCRDTVLDREVAVKVLGRQGRGTVVRQRSRDRLEREARLLARLRHPNIATVHALHYEGDVPCIVMEHVPGRTLRQLLQEGSLTPLERVRICRGIAAGLEAAHAQQLVHQDLKPANVIIEMGDGRDEGDGIGPLGRSAQSGTSSSRRTQQSGAPGTPKILDFGIARIAAQPEVGEGAQCDREPLPASGTAGGDTGSSASIAFGRAGTPGYMSPEQERGGPVDHRADLWAFGRILQDCFGIPAARNRARGVPFIPAQGAATFPMPDAASVPVRDGASVPGPTLGQPPRPLPPGMARRLEGLAEACQQPQPERRPQSATEVRQELDRILEQLVPGPGRVRIGRLVFSHTALLLLALPLVLGIAVGLVRSVRTWQHRKAVPRSVSVDAGGQVQVRFSDDRTDLFALPDTFGQRAESTRILLGPSIEQPVVLAWTSSSVQSDESDRLVLWNSRGRLLAVLSTTEDWPDGPLDDPLFLRKRFLRTFRPDSPGDLLRTLEFSRYYPSVLRSFRLTSDGVREIGQFYHAGNIDLVQEEAGNRPGPRRYWACGRVSQGIVLEAAKGMPKETYFVACFDDTSLCGTRIYPWFEPPDSAFLARHPEGVAPAVPLYYFIVRGFLAGDGNLLRWTDTRAIRLDAATGSGDGGAGVLFGELRLDLIPEGPGHVRVRATPHGIVERELAARAARSGLRRELVIRQFFTDSVLSLADAPASIRITGDCRDLRHSLPRLWARESREPAVLRSD